MKTAIRTGHIEIDTVKLHGPKWISASLQTLEIDPDGNVLSERMRDKKLYRKVTDVAMQTVTTTDPVTGQAVTVSVAGLGALVKAAMISWMLDGSPIYV